MSEYSGFVLVWDHNFLSGVTGCRKTWMSVTCDRSVVSSGTPVSYTNKTDRHDITEILWKGASNFMISVPTIVPDSAPITE
jgi:hypothetical protein